AARARDHGAHREILRDRKGRKDLPSFGHLADAKVANAVARPARDVLVVKDDAAASRLLNAPYGADQRRLAGTIGAADRNDGALLDLERYAIDRLRIAMKHVHVLEAEHQTASAPR